MCGPFHGGYGPRRAGRGFGFDPNFMAGFWGHPGRRRGGAHGPVDLASVNVGVGVAAGVGLVLGLGRRRQKAGQGEARRRDRSHMGENRGNDGGTHWNLPRLHS